MSKPQAQLFLEDYIQHITEPTDMNAAGVYREYKDWYREQSMDPRFMIASPNSLGMYMSRYNGKLFNKYRQTSGYLYRFTPQKPQGGAGGP
jgi:hypothetical protein